MKRMKFRIISSISDVITNSSTQVFFLDIDDKLKNLLETNSVLKNSKDISLCVIHGKEDFIDQIRNFEKIHSENRFYTGMIFRFINNALNGKDDGTFSTYYGEPGWIWEELKKAGRSYIETAEFIWPVIERNIGKNGILFFEYEDDCYCPEEAKVLEENGYNSYRDL